MKCYEYEGVPESEQRSNPPKQGGPALVWKKGVRRGSLAAGEDPFQLEPLGGAPPPKLKRNEWQELLPVERCPDRCSDRGSCVDGAEGVEGPVCVCAPFYEGANCAAAARFHCPLNCSGRGSCHGGFCHCEPGYWGAGCARSKAYTAEEWSPHPTQLRVYVYDLPEHVTYMRPDNDERPLHHTIYLAEVEFHQRLLGDWAVRTENPWEANLFYVPTHTYYVIGNVGFPGKLFSTVFRHVREAHPWWNMTAGRNHVAASSNDRGCCDLYRMTPDVQHPIKLVHFAQAPRHGSHHPGGRKGGEGSVAWGEDPRLLAARLASSVEDPAMVGAMAEFQHLGGRPRFRGFPAYELPALQQEREICFRPEHDVAFPNYLSTQEDGWPQKLAASYRYPQGVHGPAEFKWDVQRDVFFYFQGYTKEDMAYSAGVRQGLVALFGKLDRKDVIINAGAGIQTMQRSKFCFTPMGFGWGVRLTQAVSSGCVPVLVHDHTYPTLWDVLPYERFSVRCSRHNLHRLMDALAAVTPEQLRGLQAGLAEWHRAFIWQPEYGGLAYNFTLQSLHRKLLNMWTALF